MSATPDRERRRWRLDVAYDGTDFSGWASQPGLRTVQAELERAVTVVGRAASDEVAITCAGRTDAGVHARGQVAHVDLGTTGTSELSPRRLNALLPADVLVRRVAPAPPGFDARFSAVSRRYTYRLADSDRILDPLRRHEVHGWRHPLDGAVMEVAGAALLGLHDFAAFCKARDGATTIRTLLGLVTRRDDTGVLEIELVADAFCHSMVRAVVGALVAVGEGRRPVTWPGAVLAAGVRDPAVRVMPPGGLTLEEVVYPADDELSVRAESARALRVLPPD